MNWEVVTLLSDPKCWVIIPTWRNLRFWNSVVAVALHTTGIDMFYATTSLSVEAIEGSPAPEHLNRYEVGGPVQGCLQLCYVLKYFICFFCSQIIVAPSGTTSTWVGLTMASLRSQVVFSASSHKWTLNRQSILKQDPWSSTAGTRQLQPHSAKGGGGGATGWSVSYRGVLTIIMSAN